MIQNRSSVYRRFRIAAVSHNIFSITRIGHMMTVSVCIRQNSVKHQSTALTLTDSKSAVSKIKRLLFASYRICHIVAVVYGHSHIIGTAFLSEGVCSQDRKRMLRIYRVTVQIKSQQIICTAVSRFLINPRLIRQPGIIGIFVVIAVSIFVICP